MGGGGSSYAPSGSTGMTGPSGGQSGAAARRKRGIGNILPVAKQAISDFGAAVQTQTDLNNKLSQIKNIVQQFIDKNKHKAEWFINDHGFEHGKRVERNIEFLIDILEDVGVILSTLDRPLTPEEKFMLKVAAYVHDIGRALGIKHQHPRHGAEFVRNNLSQYLTSEQTRAISLLCLLHGNGTMRDMFGTENIDDLINKGIISRREALLASILRIADALDIGKRRVEYNTQGQKGTKVIDNIKRTFSTSKAKELQSHWYGHMGIRRAYTTNRNGMFTLDVVLDVSLFASHGEDIAYRVKDLLRDINSAIRGRKLGLRLAAKNINTLENWFNQHNDIFYEETSNMDVFLEEE